MTQLIIDPSICLFVCPSVFQMEEYLEKTVQMFSYLTDKDLFAEIYRNQLAKRLLNQRSASDEMERLMIGKLKLR